MSQGTPRATTPEPKGKPWNTTSQEPAEGAPADTWVLGAWAPGPREPRRLQQLSSRSLTQQVGPAVPAQRILCGAQISP